MDNAARTGVFRPLGSWRQSNQIPVDQLSSRSWLSRPKLRVVADRREGECVVADELEALLRAQPTSVLGLATGGTMTGLYAELAARHVAGRLSFARARGFNLDEYLGLGAQDPRSFAAYMRTALVQHVDFALGAARVPRGDAPDHQAEASAWEHDLTVAGGIDLQLLGIGRNGHIGFNEPGSPRDSRTRVIELHATTREDAAAAFGGLAQVPTHALTMGIASILDARRIVLLAFGRSKAAMVRRMLQGAPSAECPASFLQHHPNTLVVLDREAAAELTVT